MNDNNLEQNQEVSNNINDDNKIVTTVVDNYKVDTDSNKNVENGVQQANMFVSTSSIEEISVSADSGSLEKVDISANSVFNNKDNEDGSVNTGGMKEGQEFQASQKGIPYGMIIGLVILILCAFFIDNIVGFIEGVILKEDSVVEETNEEKKETNKEENKGKDKENNKDDVKEENGSNKDDNNVVDENVNSNMDNNQLFENLD